MRRDLKVGLGALDGHAMRAITSIVVAALMTLGMIGFANAQVTYSYTGNPFTRFSFPPNPITSANFISGSFSVDAPLADGNYNFSFSPPPAGFSYSFTDGLSHTASNLANASSFQVNLSGGIINAWTLFLGGEPEGAFLTTTSIYGYDSTMFMGPAAVTVAGWSDIPGTWTAAVTAVPEPSTYALMLAGLGLVGFVARRRKLKEAAAA